MTWNTNTNQMECVHESGSLNLSCAFFEIVVTVMNSRRGIVFFAIENSKNQDTGRSDFGKRRLSKAEKKRQKLNSVVFEEVAPRDDGCRDDEICPLIVGFQVSTVVNDGKISHAKLTRLSSIDECASLFRLIK